MTRYRIEFAKPAIKQLKKLPRTVRQTIADSIEALADDPRPAESRKLVGIESLYRVPEGDYRIIYRVEDEVLLILVVRIGHRKDVYRNMGGIG